MNRSFSIFFCIFVVFVFCFGEYCFRDLNKMCLIFVVFRGIIIFYRNILMIFIFIFRIGWFVV